MNDSTTNPTGDRDLERSPVGPSPDVADDELLSEDDDDLIQRRKAARRERRGRGARPAAAGTAPQVGAAIPVEVAAPAKAARPSTEPASNQAPAPIEEPEISGVELAAAELGEVDDDLLQRRQKPHRVREETRVPTMTRAEKVIIVCGAIAGVCLALWFLGKPEASAQPTAAASAPAQSQQMTAEELATAVAQSRQTVESNPSDGLARLQLGSLLFNQGDFAGAREELLQATKMAPGNVQAWYYLGATQASLDPPDYEAARAAWAKVVELDPTSDIAKTVQSHMSRLSPSAASPNSTAAPTSAAAPEKES